MDPPKPSDVDLPGPGGSTGAPTCGDLTPTNIEGPFFLEGSPLRNDIRGDNPGRSLRLTGRVFDAACRPLGGAILDFWQADEDGAYDEEGTTFRGHQTTDEDGAYALESIVPGRYLNGSQYRPAHLHVKVSARGMTLTTQLYFEGDPFNEVDPFIDLALVVANVIVEDDRLTATFDFVLPD